MRMCVCVCVVCVCVRVYVCVCVCVWMRTLEDAEATVSESTHKKGKKEKT